MLIFAQKIVIINLVAMIKFFYIIYNIVFKL